MSKASESLLTRFSDPAKFITQFNLDWCGKRYIKFKTPEVALFSGLIKVREISDCYGEKSVVTWIESWLVQVSLYMNFEISKEQSGKTAMYILEELYMLNLAEITLFFKRIMKGKYGEFYGKFNGQIIIRAAVEYRQERGKIVSKLSDEEYQKLTT